MTTAYRTEKKCAVCGNVSQHFEITSTIVIGSSDLDLRPPELKRSTIDMWVQRCPSCGYCAPDISELIEKSEEIVRSESYQQQLNNPEFPELANSFLCCSLIKENTGNLSEAGWNSLFAAWACDDAKNDVSAQACRKRAADLFRKARANGQKFAEQEALEDVIMADLLRRAGQFEEALEFCNDGLEKKPEKICADILMFQMDLISRKDTARHTIGEVTGEVQENLEEEDEDMEEENEDEENGYD